MNGTITQTTAASDSQTRHELEETASYVIDETPGTDTRLCATCSSAESVEDLCLGCYVSALR